MAKNIEPSLKLISEYLKIKTSESFVVPEYQRGYSWSISQCDKLWNDIEQFIETGSDDPYFFGTIIVDCSDTESKAFNLIDGQQRTTTFLLLLKALLVQLHKTINELSSNDESESLKYGLSKKRDTIIKILYQVDDEKIPAIIKNSFENIESRLFINKSVNELHKDEINTILNSTNYETIESNVKKIPRKRLDNKYTNHFRNFKYFYTRLNEKSESQLNLFAQKFLDECQIIEIRSWDVSQAITMFNSLNSTGIPLSDADIISAKMYSNAGEDRELFMQSWRNVLEQANKLNEKNILDIDNVLQYYMYYLRTLNRESVYTNEQGILTINVTTPGIRRYYTELNSSILNEPIKLCEQFQRITAIWENIQDHPTVKLLSKFNENAKIFLTSYLLNKYQEDKPDSTLDIICQILLRVFALLELSDSGYSSTKFKTFLFGLNSKLIDENISIDTISSEVSHHIATNWKREQIQELIEEYNKNNLVFLNEYLYCQIHSLKFDFKENVNVEHIMPSSGRNITTIQIDAGITDIDEFYTIVNKLGNKILLEEDVNKSIGRDWFKTKIQHSVDKKLGYKDSKYAIAQSLLNSGLESWTVEDIDKATHKAAQRICNFIFMQD